jgi:ribosomal protein S18 acetylase RimI-like enzyme
VATTLASAFCGDPAWSWVFADPETREANLRAVWSVLLAGAVDYGWVSMAPGAAAATLWIPPGRPELTEGESARIEQLFYELLGPGVDRADSLMREFAAARPGVPEHFYLSLFGTRPDCQGRGIGMALLATDLARIDAEHMPAYLESTNPANLDRYRSIGFVEHGEITLPDGGPVVTTMWRDAR